MKKDLIFVYGTLRRGEQKHALMADNFQYLGRATVKGSLFDLGAYPALIADSTAQTEVIGELYRPLTANGLALLDDYEGCSAQIPVPHEYVRVMLTVTVDNKQIPAWSYCYNWPLQDATRIVSGDYADRALIER